MIGCKFHLRKTARNLLISYKRNSSPGTLVRLASACLFLSSFLWNGVAVPQGADVTQQQVDIYKNLPKEQQDALLQGTLGRNGAAKQKNERAVPMPDTIRNRKDVKVDEYGRPIEEKTRDGRNLRLTWEDPELRPGDSVLVELTSRYEEPVKQKFVMTPEQRNAQLNNQQVDPNALPRQKPKPEDKRSDEQKQRSEDLRKRILRHNPYKLNRFGVIEIPDLPAMPLAGLTAREAAERIAADPALVDFEVKVILLRLQSFGDEALKPFGYDLFEGSPSTFAPVTDVPVPGDYVVGPGDVLDIQLYGNEPATYSLAVNRDGRVDFPKLGPIMVGGMSFDRARSEIEARVRRQLLGSRVSVTMGDLRTIRVYVLGEAQKPGSYLVSGLSTMTNALLVSGGVKKIGSLRNIQLKRKGKLISELDLYDLLLHGDTSGDRQLMPGDVIFIPPVGDTAAVYGEVQRPAIYEFKGEHSAGELIALAGGLTPEADPRTGSLEHISKASERITKNIDLSLESGRSTPVGNGDKLRVSPIRPTLEDSVTLAGHVYRPNSFQYREGMRISDVLPSFNELRPHADRHYILIRREIPPEHRLQVVSADLERALENPGSAADVLLQPRDQVMVFDLSNDRERFIAPLIHDLELQGTIGHPAQIVSVTGQVKAPGKYPLEPDMRVSDLIRAGGSLEDSAYGGEAELTRYQVVNGEQRQTELIKINLAALRQGDTSADVPLKAFDSLVIKEIPDWSKPEIIEVEGEVRFPGKYPIQHGETLHSILARAGGLTDLGYAKGAIFTRKVLKEREKHQIELLSNRFQSDLTSLTLQSLAPTAGTSNSNTAGTAIAVGQELIEQLRDTKPVGRLVIDIDEVMKRPAGSEGDVLVKDGDKLMVPKKTQEITVIGEVANPTSHVMESGLTRDDYIAKSGGVTAKADRKRIYVVHADGSVDSDARRGFFRRGATGRILPGDTIVVPLDAERIRPLPLWTAVTTIIYNLAIAAAAVSRF